MSDLPLGSFGTMVCQKVSYLDALLLDISGGGEAVSSDLCDSSNVTVLEFLSGPTPTSSTVASPKAISCSSPEFALFVWPPSICHASARPPASQSTAPHFPSSMEGGLYPLCHCSTVSTSGHSTVIPRG